ncbi:hypothetical protein GCWU000324_02385 [Kingella oralis ATCC 51147]|uniref:Uncharacterized protein n=1 Tax=Kingella oralis ATCC 51147 TaxID=629741 RepID=C4GK10_9NEIS|nr:hypothetical protein GCWU000324_02385 [Kingella oralis ATCC 51147]
MVGFIGDLGAGQVRQPENLKWRLKKRFSFAETRCVRFQAAFVYSINSR